MTRTAIDYQTFTQRRAIEDAIIYFGQRATDPNFAGQEAYHFSTLVEALGTLGDEPDVTVGEPKGVKARRAGKAQMTFRWRKAGDTTAMTMDPAVAQAAAGWWDSYQTAFQTKTAKQEAA